MRIIRSLSGNRFKYKLTFSLGVKILNNIYKNGENT